MFVFTSCTNNYIPKARVLASTLKKFHQDWTFCLLLGESPPNNFSLNEEHFDQLLTFDQLNIPSYKSWLFRHRVVEICTAAKGPALYHFLTQEGHEKVIYLDPDIMVCNTLETLNNLLDEYDILLTPHQLAPQETTQSVIDNELCAMQYGVFNLGFIAAARRGDGLNFARWWRNRLFEYCYDDIPHGLFTDQRWCDLAPAFFPKLHIVRDPGCNAASWNLTDRTITRASDGTFIANDTPLRFYHFTGFDSGAGVTMTERYAKHMPAVHELWKIYQEQLIKAEHEKFNKLRWKYAIFPDGTPITDDMRLTYRSREDVRRAFPDPFYRPGYLEWFTAEKNKSKFSYSKRYINKICFIYNKTKQVIKNEKGIQGALRQILFWIRKWGVLGMLRKIWTQTPDYEIVKDNFPSLRQVLNSTESLFFTMLTPNNTPVCIIEHDWGGGAELYCNNRILNILNQNKAVIRVRYVVNIGKIEIIVQYQKDIFKCTTTNIREIIDERFPKITSIIINELAGWHYCNLSFYEDINKIKETIRDIIDISKYNKANIEFLFHDYFAVCPTTTLITSENKYCGLPPSEEWCDVCALRGKPFSMQKWRASWKELLSLSDSIVFFSQDTLDRVLQVYPFLRKEQIQIRPHKLKPLVGSLTITKDVPMRIAVVGHIQIHKGAYIIAELAKILEQEMPEASLVIFGTLEPSVVSPNVVILGPYERDELGILMEQQKITIGLFPSIWPETFSFVIHEMAFLGLPLVTFDLGAQGAFARTQTNSRVVPEISAQAAFKALKELDATRHAKTSFNAENQA